MSILSQLGSLIGGEDAQRLASGQGNFQSPDSPDVQRVQEMFSKLNPQQQQQVFSQAAQQMNPQDYAAHMNPNAGGSSPLSNIGSAGLRTIASTLLQHLGAGGITGNLLSRIPGLQTHDPAQMDQNQVAALARYTQQNHPDLFGRAAAQIGQQQPDLLHSFLGKAGLAIGAAALASHFMKTDQ